MSVVVSRSFTVAVSQVSSMTTQQQYGFRTVKTCFYLLKTRLYACDTQPWQISQILILFFILKGELALSDSQFDSTEENRARGDTQARVAPEKMYRIS